MSYLKNEPLRKGDSVKVTGSGTGFDGTLGTVDYVNNLTGMALFRHRRGSCKDIHISKLTLLDRPLLQPSLI